MKSWQSIKTIVATAVLFCAVQVMAVGPRQMESLDRGVVAVKVTGGVYVGWRVLGTDPSTLSFNVYRGTAKVNATPITGATNLLDAAGTTTSSYTVRPVLNGVEQTASPVATVWANFWKSIPLHIPAGGTTPDGVAYTYSPSDMSTGDVDGDGQYELIVKWDPSNSKDNSQSGYTGNVYLDAYKLDGSFLWRIDLGVNIRAGAHYTQFLVGDYDGDGKAEVACKTAPGTKDGAGAYISKGAAATATNTADYRSAAGYILTGPEYLTIFNGKTGKEMATVNYNPGRGTVSKWGDSYGNRVDRFLATNAYLDGVKPSMVFQRGYYTRMTLAAWDWDGTTLKQRWFFDSDSAGNSAFAGQGNHNLTVGDVDGDGYDEIIEGASAIDHNGKALYVTGLGHGDALHMGDMDPTRAGEEVWEIHEDCSTAAPCTYGSEMHDAATGKILWGLASTGDVGRGMAADIDANSPGYEVWSANSGGVYSSTGTLLSTSMPSNNFRIYWDGDLQDELLDGTKLDKWNGNGTSRLVSFYNYPAGNGATQCNGTKSTPNLLADLFGDWREEVVYHTANNDSLLIFTTTTLTQYRLYTLMHDPQYRDAISWQNGAYNQPPHLSFLLGNGVDKAPVPNIVLVGASTSSSSSVASSSSVVVSSSVAVSSSALVSSSSKASSSSVAGSSSVAMSSTAVISSSSNVIVVSSSSAMVVQSSAASSASTGILHSQNLTNNIRGVFENDMLVLSGIDGGVTQVRLRNAKGTIVATAEATQGVIDCHDLVQGLYLVEVVQNQHTVNVFTAIKF